MSESNQIHCFEKAGLGKAPFRYVGMVEQNIQYGQAVIGNVGGCALTTKPGGSCAYCGTSIVNMFNVESADGNRFHVGCECIRKTGDSGLVKLVERDVKEMERKRREAKKAAALAKDQEVCDGTDLNIFANRPHPNAYFASEGKTLADWARWMRDNKNYKGLALFIRADNNREAK